MTKDSLRAIKEALDAASPADRKTTFDSLRKEFPIHRLEREWNVQAEIILDAIARSSDFTQRGIRGVIAEAAFGQYVVPPLIPGGWRDITKVGDVPYDFELEDGVGPVKIQVKNQRRLNGKPMLWRDMPGIFVAETDKSRKGEKDGKKTRCYRYGEFDILAVCMHPSTNNWSSFLYTVANWLLSRKEATDIRAHQPIDPKATSEWTNDFSEVIARWRSGVKQTLTIPAKPRTPRKS